LIKGPGTDEQRPAGLSLHGMAGGLQGDGPTKFMDEPPLPTFMDNIILMVIIMVNP